MCRQTQKRVRPTTELGSLCGCGGKSQPEARFPFNKYLWHLLSANRARLSHWARPCPGTDEGLRGGAGARPGAEDHLALGSASALGGPELCSQLGPHLLAKNY